MRKRTVELREMQERLCCHAKSLQSYSTPCNSMDYSLPGSSVRGILQTRLLEWVAMPSSGGSSGPKDRPASLLSLTSAGGFFTASATWETRRYEINGKKKKKNHSRKSCRLPFHHVVVPWLHFPLLVLLTGVLKTISFC